MGEKSEYSENVPSDLEFLGGHFNFMSRLALEGEEEGESPALGLVKKVLLQALSTRSWDLSVQPFEESTLVRGKNDDSWREFMRFPAARHKEFTIEVSRLWCGVSELYWGLPFDGRLLVLPVPACALVRQAREDGLVSLRETALKMVLDGVISFQEAVSATPEPYFELR